VRELRIVRGRLYWWAVWDGDRELCSGVTLTRWGARRQAREFMDG
jgi:hypothetical protein